MVFVGINHRLSVFGYLYFSGKAEERFATAGNVGQLDLVAALQWVRENIEGFGGDPQNVTIFGHSGGGGKVGALLGMPSARGLFHKAIIESGSVMKAREPEDAADFTRSVFEATGIRDGDIEALQRVPTEKLLDCFYRLSALSLPPYAPDWQIITGPTVDGVVIPRQLWEGGVPEFSRTIPMIIGNTLHETAPAARAYPEIADDRTLVTLLEKAATGGAGDPWELMQLLQTYRQVMPHLNNTELLVRVSTDVDAWRNALEQVELKVRAGGAPVYMYECDWRTPCFGGMWAPHGVELPFVFHDEHYGTLWDVDSDARRAAADPENDRYRLGARVLTAWTNFARTGNPSSSDLRWPSYELKSRPTMIFDRISRVVEDLRSEVRPAVASLRWRQLV